VCARARLPLSDGTVYASLERGSEPTIVLAPPAPLRLEALGRVAAGAPVALGAGARERLAASHRQLLALARAGRVVYGLNTGCGPLCDRAVPPAAAARFQRNLVRSHASGLGPAHPAPVVRATMALRAFSLAQGRSAVRPLVVETLVAMLNAGIHPVVPETGSVGAGGDLVELAHVARALMGEGEGGWCVGRRPRACARSSPGAAVWATAPRRPRVGTAAWRRCRTPTRSAVCRRCWAPCAPRWCTCARLSRSSWAA